MFKQILEESLGFPWPISPSLERREVGLGSSTLSLRITMLDWRTIVIGVVAFTATFAVGWSLGIGKAVSLPDLNPFLALRQGCRRSRSA